MKLYRDLILSTGVLLKYVYFFWTLRFIIINDFNSVKLYPSKQP